MTSSALVMVPESLDSRTIASMRWMHLWQSWNPRVMSCVKFSMSRSSAFLVPSSSKPGSTCFWCSLSSFCDFLAMSASRSVTSSVMSAQRGGSKSISITASPSSW